MNTLKSLTILFCVFLLSNCKKEAAKTIVPRIQDYSGLMTITIKAPDGSDLLDPANPKNIMASSKYVYYLINGEKKPITLNTGGVTSYPESASIHYYEPLKMYYLEFWLSPFVDKNNITTTYIDIDSRYSIVITANMRIGADYKFLDKVFYQGKELSLTDFNVPSIIDLVYIP